MAYGGEDLIREIQEGLAKSHRIITEAKFQHMKAAHHCASQITIACGILQAMKIKIDARLQEIETEKSTIVE